MPLPVVVSVSDCRALAVRGVVEVPMPTAFKVMVSALKSTSVMLPSDELASMLSTALITPAPLMPCAAVRSTVSALTMSAASVSDPRAVPIMRAPTAAFRIKVDWVEAGRRSMMLATVRSPTLVLMSRVMMSVSVSAAMLTVVGRVSAAARLKSRLIVCVVLTSVVAIRVVAGNSVAMM